jgi:hypothetical protein
MAEGVRSLVVSGLVILAAPLVVTGFAAAGVTPGDALNALGVGGEKNEPAETVTDTGHRSSPADDGEGNEARTETSTRPTDGSSARSRAADGSAGDRTKPDADRGDEAPTAPAEPAPPEPAPPAATAPETPEPAAPAEPEPAPDPLGEVTDALDDPVGAADEIIDEGLGGLLP